MHSIEMNFERGVFGEGFEAESALEVFGMNPFMAVELLHAKVYIYKYTFFPVHIFEANITLI